MMIATAKLMKNVAVKLEISKFVMLVQPEGKVLVIVILVNNAVTLKVIGAHVRGKSFPHKKFVMLVTTIVMDKPMRESHLAFVILVPEGLLEWAIVDMVHNFAALEFGGLVWGK